MFGLFNINGWEYVIIAVVALMVIGPEQLPTVMRQIGHYTRQFRDTSEKLKTEFMTGVNELDPNNWIDPEADPVAPRKLDKKVSPGGPRQAASADESDDDPGADDQSELPGEPETVEGLDPGEEAESVEDSADLEASPIEDDPDPEAEDEA